MVCGCFGGSETLTLNRKFPIAQSHLQSGLSISGIRVLWWLKNPDFESPILNGSKSHSFRACPHWYLGALVAQNPILEIANSQWSKVSYNQGRPSVVSGCFGGSKTRTLNCKYPMVQSLILSGLALTGMWVLWWLRNPYFPSSNSQWFKVTYFQGLPSVVSGWLKNPDFESPILNSSKSYSFRACLQWYVGVWWLRNPSFESQTPNGSKSHLFRVHHWYLDALVAHRPVLGIANSQWFKVSYIPGCPSVVSCCSGGSRTRTLNRKFPILQSLLQSRLSLSGIWVLW